MTEEWIPIDNDPLLPPALAALGFHVKPNVHLFPDAESQKAHKSVTWMVAPQSADKLHDARELVPAWLGKTLLKTSPNHPLLAALFALQTRQVLGDWQRGIHGMPHIVILPGHNLARAVPPTTRTQAYDISTHLDGKEPMALDHAAAAITAGHGVAGMLSRGCTVSTKSAFSMVVTAGTLAAAAAQIEATPAKSATLTLPGFPAGEHPFLYALSAIRQSRALKQMAETMDPTLHLTSRASEKVALVSQSIMDGTAANKELQKFKHHVHLHTRS